jgi:hypothetical protein
MSCEYLLVELAQLGSLLDAEFLGQRPARVRRPPSDRDQRFSMHRVKAQGGSQELE